MSQAFSELFNLYHDKFVRFANRYVRNLPVAEDLTIDAFMYYWENRDRLSGDINVPAYILTTIKHNSLSYLRHQYIHEDVTSHMLTDMQWELSRRIARLEYFEPEEVFTHEIMDLINKALQALPDQTREIFIMSRQQYLSHKEIAGKLNLSVKSVEFHINKAMKALKVELKDYYPLLMIFLC